MRIWSRRLRRWASLAALGGLVPTAAPAAGAALTGRVELVDRGRPSAEAGAAVVYFVPDAGASPAAPRQIEIMTRNRHFLPRTLAVPVGSTVRFPNDDAIQHNVFSISPGNRFDLGRYGKGRGRAQTFSTPGVVRLFCNVHRNMAATVLVLETPFFTQPDADGRFEIVGAPPGTGMLHVWHPRSEPWSIALRLPVPEPLTIRLEAILPPVPAHLDKFGRPYRDDPDETYR